MNIIEMIIAFTAILFTITWIFLFFTGQKRFKEDTQRAVNVNKDKNTDEHLNNFICPDMLFIGFRFMEILGLDLKSDFSKNRIGDIVLVNGARNAETCYRNLRAYEWFLFFTISPVILIFISLIGSTELIIFYPILAALAFAREYEIFLESKKVKEEIEMDFPKVMSKLTILIGSGMVVRNAWQKVAADGNGRLYEEMRITSRDMVNGVPETIAYRQFGERVDTPEAKKFAGLISQNLLKGSSELVGYMTELTEEMWKDKELKVTKKTAEAVQKLIIPSALIFIGILILILVPIFSQMNLL